MNLSKKIDVASKSSLVSLRAELARKHEEVAKAKSQSQAQFIRPIPKPKKETILTKKNTGIDERIEKDVIELKEDEDIHKKSRAALENKAKLYDKLSQNSALVDDDDDVTSRYLVDFQQKSDDNKAFIITPTSSTVANVIESDDEDAPRDSDEYDVPSDPEEDWVDYTDCLGRTRRCLRRDLKYIKEKDVTLSESLGYVEDRQGTISDPATPTPATTTPADPELLSADMRQELIRQKWETQEQDLKDKSDIHYQDVLFDEARSHGVGYYGFSADEQKRRTQQEALSKLRDETQKQQASAQSLKERRQQQLKARLKAAKQRKRARMGLPPEEESEPEEESSKAMEEAKKAAEERKAEEDRKAEEEKDKLDRAKKRQYVRPWDVGKDGVTAKETEVLSQEDWVKKRRTVRDDEFAPPSSYQDDLRLSQSRRHRHSSQQRGAEEAKRRKKAKVLAPIRSEVFHSSSGDSDREDDDDERSSSPGEPPPGPVTSRGRGAEEAKRRKKAKVLAPIRNEVFHSSSGDSDRRDDDDERSSSPSEPPPGPGTSRGRGAEVAPPPTFDYCGPSSVATERSKRGARGPKGDVEGAISAGLKFLRHQFEEKQKQQKEKGLLDII